MQRFSGHFEMGCVNTAKETASGSQLKDIGATERARREVTGKPSEAVIRTRDSMGRICINWLMLVKCFEDGNSHISAWYYYYADNGYVEESWR